MNVNQKYGKKREAREKDRLNIELKYKQGLLFLKNEEVDEWMDICKEVHDGELVYDFHLATVNLGKAIRFRDELLEDIKELERDINGNEDEF